jgi:hypothetical protein
MCQYHTLRLVITVVRITITVVSVVITFVRVKITLCLEITLFFFLLEGFWEGYGNFS